MPSNMTFKTNLIPNTNLDFALGSSDRQWKINGLDDPKLSDENVAQNNSTEAKNFRVLLSGSDNDTDATEGTNKSTNLRFNPSTKVFSVGGNINATGDLTITGNANLNSETYAESITVGSLLVNGAANFVNIPTAPTPEATSNDTSIATTAFVMNAFTVNDAMVFKGVINANSDLPADHEQGWTYRIGTAGTYANKVCEVGDIIICVTEGTSANNDHWAVIQNNIDGAVYKGANNFTDTHVIIADSTAGKVKDSGKTITATAPSNSAADTTIPTSKAVWSAISGGSARDNTKLPLAGGTMTGAIKRYYSAASTDPVIAVTANNLDATALWMGHGSAAGNPSGNYYKFLYKGTGSSPNNDFQLIAGINSSSEVIAMQVNEQGNVSFTNKVTADISGNAATVTVTKTTPAKKTYYPVYTTSTTTGAQSLQNDTRFYYYDTGTTSYLNIGNTSNSGGLTLHNANGKYGDIVSSAFTANRTFTLPDKTGTFSLTSDLSDYLPLAGGTMTGALNFSGDNSRALTWNDATWQQRIQTVDDSTANTNVFIFQQSSDAGSNWTDLMSIKDNGHVVATAYNISDKVILQYNTTTNAIDFIFI